MLFQDVPAVLREPKLSRVIVDTYLQSVKEYEEAEDEDEDPPLLTETKRDRFVEVIVCHILRYTDSYVSKLLLLKSNNIIL